MGFGKDNTGVIIREVEQVTLGTLASKTAILGSAKLAITEDFRMLKTKVFASIQDATAVEGDGPMIIGICNGELSASEVTECINAEGPLGPDDAVPRERAERAVFPMFAIGFQDDASPMHIVNNDGNPIVHKNPWTYRNANGWNWFAFNMGGSALTTGGIVHLIATHYGLWVG